jgi:hypothetical protein
MTFFASVGTLSELAKSSKHMDGQDAAIPVRVWRQDRPPEYYCGFGTTGKSGAAVQPT